MDIIRAPLVPDKNTKGPKKKLDDYTYYYEDENSGVWPIRRYEPNLMMFSSVDSSFRRDGLSAVEKFVNGLKDEEIDVEKNSFEAMEMLVERMGNERAITASSVIGIPLEASWLRALYEKPTIVENYLDRIVKREIFLISKYRKIGLISYLEEVILLVTVARFLLPIFKKNIPAQVEEDRKLLPWTRIALHLQD